MTLRMKRYEVDSIAEAMELIRGDLGEDAIVIHQREIKRPSALGLRTRPGFEVIAAIDSDKGRSISADTSPPTARPATPTIRRESIPVRKEITQPPQARVTPTEPKEQNIWPEPDREAVDRIAISRQATLRLAEKLREAAPKTKTATRPVDGASPTTIPGREERSDDPRSLDPIRRDLSELRDVLSRLATPGDRAALARLAPKLAVAYDNLIAQELEPELAITVIEAVRLELSERALEDPEAVTDGVRRHLRRLVRQTGPIQTAIKGGVVFVIGPTGVGKTTTIAKLAAHLVLDRRRVAMITIDTFRVAAIPQLQTYAEIIGVPLEVVYTPEELREAIERNRDRDYVLVDTPGRSQYNEPKIAEIAEYINVIPERTVYLALSAATRYGDLQKICQRFGVIPCEGLLFTKLDETSSFGALINLAHRMGKPLTYLTTGQNVPSDIEVASGERLAQLVTEGHNE